MKQLLYKEFRLAASPLSYIFLAFSFMTLIPGYPILVGSFFVCLGIFYSFQFSREFHDILYTALLPVPKAQVVTAKYLFCTALELLSLLIVIGLTVLRLSALSGAAVYADSPMMKANMAYLGYVLMVFALFNTVFLGGFFRTAYGIGKPFILFCIVTFVLIGIAETLHHIPGLTFLNGTDMRSLCLQCAVLAFGGICFFGGTAWSWRHAQERFVRLDL